MDAQLLQALGHVGWHVLQVVLRQVEALQLGQWGEGLGVDDGDFVVNQDQSLYKEKHQGDERIVFSVNTVEGLPLSPKAEGNNQR